MYFREMGKERSFKWPVLCRLWERSLVCYRSEKMARDERSIYGKTLIERGKGGPGEAWETGSNAKSEMVNTKSITLKSWIGGYRKGEQLFKEGIYKVEQENHISVGALHGTIHFGGAE